MSLDLESFRLSLALWGQPAQLRGMRVAARGVNARPEPDPDRAERTVTVIRSESAARIGLSDNGLGRTAGAFRGVPASKVHIVSLEAGGAWEPRAGDQIIYADRPSAVYLLAETRPDGGAGLHFILNEIGRG